MLEYRTNGGRRLVCPEALGGCGALTINDSDDEGRGPDWTCPMCNREWNTHDAEIALEEAEA